MLYLYDSSCASPVIAMRAKYFWRFVVGLALCITLAGCDAAYYLRVENHSQERLIVNVLAHDIDMGPCSVHLSHVIGPPRDSLPVTVTDLDWRAVDTVVLIPEQEKGWGVTSETMTIRIPPEPQRSCPAQVEDRFLLTVYNWTPEDLPVAVRGTILGVVPRQSHHVFGPIDGSWREIDFPTVPDATGDDRLNPPGANDLGQLTAPLHHDMGAVPNFEMHIKTQ